MKVYRMSYVPNRKEQNMRNRRRQRFIDPAVQGTLIKRVTFHWLVFFAASFILLPVWQVLFGGVVATSFAQALLDAWVRCVPVYAVLLVLLPLFILDIVVLSHRFAGPIYRLRQTVRSLADGEHIQRMKFRDGDFWMDIADDFNRMLDRWNAERAGLEENDAKESVRELTSVK
jgi:methyl-accepting chemotaxis protein